jgi:hypothetical protein
MTDLAIPLDLLKYLEQRIVEQKETVKNSCDDEDKIKASKESTKSALFTLFSAISKAPKDVLTPEMRQQIDAELMVLTKGGGATVLKFPLLRALQDPGNYRAFLGLPQIMEQTRRFLTQVSVAKLRDILGENSLDLNAATDAQELVWVENGLQFMTGDGKRKKELGGFVLQDKSVVRGAINRATQKRKELEKSVKAAAKNTKPETVQYELERDVRLVDQEREQARANDFGSLIDNALKK